MNKIHIPNDGLLAGERYLREHVEEFDDGTQPGFHADFIEDLVSVVLNASRTGLLMPYEMQNKPPQNFS